MNKQITCPSCGAEIPAPEIIPQIMGVIGRRGRGAAKRRNVDYATLAAKSHAARRANAAKRQQSEV